MPKMLDPVTGAISKVPEATEDITIQVGQMAAGGHCVAQHDGRAVFVRHAIPGETVVARITGEGPSGRFLLADTIEVLTPQNFVGHISGSLPNLREHMRQDDLRLPGLNSATLCWSTNVD